MYTLDGLKNKSIHLGKRGEAGAIVLEVDLTPWYVERIERLESGVPFVFVARPTEPDTSAYAPAEVDLASDPSGIRMAWTVDAYDTAYAGRGRAEVVLMDMELMTVKIYPFHTYVTN